MVKIKEESYRLKEQFDLVHETVSKRLEQQINMLSSLDTKASIFLALLGILFIGYVNFLIKYFDIFLEIPHWDFFLVFILGRSITVFSFINWEFCISIPIVVLNLLFFGLSVFYAFKAFILNKDEVWRNDPDPDKLLKSLFNNYKKGIVWLKTEIMINISESYKLNNQMFVEKYNHFIRARNFLYLAALLFLIHLVIYLISN